LKLVSITLYLTLLVALVLAHYGGTKSTGLRYLLSMESLWVWIVVLLTPTVFRVRGLFLGKGNFRSRLFTAGLGIMIWVTLIAGILEKNHTDPSLLLYLIPLLAEVWIFSRVIEERQVIHARR
jgi:hypothetical protein